MKSTSTLFIHATIITVDNERTIWLDGAILVNLDRIVAVGKTAQLLHDPLLPTGTKIVDCSGRIILPGLINTHAHLAQSLLRGLAEDVPLHSWLCDSIWPFEANYDADDGYVAARLTIAEMLRSGTTCFLEAMLTYRSGFENVARAVEEMGIRACLGKLVKVEETNTKTGMTDARDRDVASMSIENALEAHQKYHGSCGGRVHVWMAAGTPRGSSESSHKAIGDVCAEHGIGLTMHCAEAPKDLSIYRDCYDCSPVEFCQRNNLIGNERKTVLAHMVNLDLEKDSPLLQQANVTVAHNPSSNCKLASGIAPVPELMASGVNVSLGTDGAPCANTYDMIQEMRLAALIQKGTRKDAKLLGAEDVLAMATINGARALGLDKETGSLEVAKKADFIVLDPSGLHCAPFDQDQILDGGLDPVTTVVYSCSGADVEMVVVDGQLVVEEHQLVSADEGQIKERARHSVKRIRERSEVQSHLKRNFR
ncbi:5-methylthioadenosine/S-adenosylhomocysteine deaminase [Exophiala viscosa]|uniref:5-methylthioadenosine/S-adenosylhomocysteine deaminase n=1 Tax=Exophiala viscosa TaxID=2486360 RepID=A0AAN6DR55_9EURO|nr:5-methylthioadenosine/S-adenosylhomocysteine deaminase [Exophiala viscosa]KAI1620676.1 5-methylthioadenosine/S-adenosylhomocysteine deaminase [Exophiala viscosa]